MKVSRATVKLYLKTAKKLSDGRSPIMLRVCWHGFKDISTHYSAFIKEWDKRNECVKSSCPNFVMVNHQLSELKNSVIKKRDEYIRLGIEYTPSMLLSFDEVEKNDSNVVADLISQYYKDKELRGSSITGWKYDITLLNEYHHNLIVSELTEGWCKRYGRWLLNNKGLAEGTVRTRLGHIACIYRYAAGKGLCDMVHYPYRDWNYCREYHLSEKVDYIHSKSIEVIKDYFLSKVIRMDGNLFTYIDDGYLSYKNRLFVIYFWLLGYMMQGLSPIDLCLLKKEDFKRIVVNGEDYWSIDTSRLKTGVKVKIRIRVHTIYSQVMIWRMLGEVDGEWFLPIMHGLDGRNLEKCKGRLSSIMSYWMCGKLADWWREINSVIIQKNVDEDLKIPLINEECTFYSYRHSFATAYMAKGGNPMALATLMGRSVNTLSVYVQQLSEQDELVEAVSVMDD